MLPESIASSSSDLYLWEGLAHRPVALFQSGALGRHFPLGPLLRLRQTDEETRRFHRALSQSVFYLSPSATAAVPTRDARWWAVLESTHEIFQRGELAPPHPAVERRIQQTFGVEPPPDSDHLDAEQSLAQFRAWASAHVPDAVLDPIVEFDDERNGAALERRVWEHLQAAEDGVFRRWSHPQVAFGMLGPADYSTDSRRADFVLCPPVADPVVWEVHGDFDLRDSDKDQWLRRHGWKTFNQIAGVTKRSEVRDLLVSLNRFDADSHAGVPEMLDAFWIAS